MADTGTIEEHSLYHTFRRANDKRLYLNSSIEGNTDRVSVYLANGILGRIYDVTKEVPAVGAVFMERNKGQRFKIVSVGYTVFVDDSVLVTFGLQVL